MRKFGKSMAVMLSLSMTLSMGTPVFAEDAAVPAQTENTSAVVTPAPEEQPTVTATPAEEVKIPRTGLYTKDGETYYNLNGKQVKSKYGIKIGKNYYRIDKGIVTQVSEAEGLAGIRYEKCGRNLKKAFKWCSTKIKYSGTVKKPRKGQKEVEYYASYGYKYGKGDCYVMAAAFCMIAKVSGCKNVKFIKGSVPQGNGKDGEHAWCEITYGKKIYAYDPNFAYSFRGKKNVHSGYKFTYGTKGTYKYNKKRVKVTV